MIYKKVRLLFLIPFVALGFLAQESAWSFPSTTVSGSGSYFGFSELACSFNSPEPAGVKLACEAMGGCPDASDVDTFPQKRDNGEGPNPLPVTLKSEATGPTDTSKLGPIAFCGILDPIDKKTGERIDEDGDGTDFQKNKAAFFVADFTFQAEVRCENDPDPDICVYEIFYDPAQDPPQVLGTLTQITEDTPDGGAEVVAKIPSQLIDEDGPDFTEEGCPPADQPCVVEIGLEKFLKTGDFKKLFPEIESIFAEGQILFFEERAIAGESRPGPWLARYCHNRFEDDEMVGDGLVTCDKVGKEFTAGNEERELGIEVTVDYRPNTNDDINVNGDNVVPILILSDNRPGFFPSQIDPSTVRVQGTIPRENSFTLRDADGDGVDDLEFKAFEALIGGQFTGIVEDGQTRFVVVTGEVCDGVLSGNFASGFVCSSIDMNGMDDPALRIPFLGEDDVIVKGVN